MSDTLTGSTDPLDARQPAPEALRVTSDLWMVGHRNPTALLQCNTYLRLFEDAGRRTRVCIDPGSQLDLAVVRSNIEQVIGNVGEIDMLTINHQDPDVVGNTGFFCNANPRVELIVSEDTWRLVQHLNFKPGKVRFANPGQSQQQRIAKNRYWRPVATPFCHFRGAMAFYDPELRTLYSGDLFGGLNQLGRVHLFAEQNDWNGIAQFHQIYMPTREVLRYAVRQIRALRPAVEIIAPQHGYAIAGDRVGEFLDRMHELLVGHDLLVFELDERFLPEYRLVVSQFVSWAKAHLGEEELFKRLTSATIDDELASHLKVHHHGVELVSHGYSTLVKIFHRFAAGEADEFVNAMRSLVLGMCWERNLPIPPIGAGIEGGG